MNGSVVRFGNQIVAHLTLTYKLGNIMDTLDNTESPVVTLPIPNLIKIGHAVGVLHNIATNAIGRCDENSEEYKQWAALINETIEILTYLSRFNGVVSIHRVTTEDKGG